MAKSEVESDKKNTYSKGGFFLTSERCQKDFENLMLLNKTPFWRCFDISLKTENFFFFKADL